MRVYAESKDRVTRCVERNLEMYAQRRQANTEMRHDFGYPSKGVSQFLNAQRSDQWRRLGDAKRYHRGLGSGQIGRSPCRRRAKK